MGKRDLGTHLEGLFSELEDTAQAGEAGQQVTERERLLAELERRALHLQTAAEVSRAASSILDPDKLIQRVVDLVGERFDLYYVGLFLVDQSGEWARDCSGRLEPGRWAVLQAGTGEAGRQMVEQGHKLEIGGESMIGWCIANAQARIALDVGEEAVRFENPLLPDTRSEMALPLMSRGQVIGAMTVQSAQESAFTDADVAILQIMCDQVANAIENARLFEQTRTALAQAEALYDASQSLIVASDPQEVLQAVAKPASQAGADVATLYYVDADAEGQPEWIEIVARMPASDAPAASVGTRYRITEFPLGRLLTANPYHLQMIDDVEAPHAGLDEYTAQILKTASARAIAVIPLTLGQRWQGIVTLSWPEPRQFSSQERQFYNMIAPQLAAHVENRRLLEQTRAALEETEAVHRLYVRERWAEFVRAQGAVSYERTRPGVEPPMMTSEQMTNEQALASQAFEQAMARREVVALSDVGELSQTDMGDEAEQAPAKGSGQAALVAPISLRGEIIGALGLYETEGRRRWTDDEIALIEAVADQMALALENARLLGETQRRAERDRLIAEITARVRSSMDPETILRTAVRELGIALGIDRTFVQLGKSTQHGKINNEQ